MAYDASNNKQDQNQVVSSTPLSGGQQPAAQTQPQDSQPNQAPSQPSTVQAGMSSTQAGAAQQPTQQKSASSGMFTNIQKYVQKNKPQAQKMASAVTQNVGSQASEIAEQAKQKEAQMKESLAANTAAMEAQKKEAGQIVGGIMGADYDPTTGQYSAPSTQKPGNEVDPNQNQIKAAFDQSRQDNQNYNNWVQSTLGDQYDTYQQELDAIRNRQLPMDFGPGSANERAGQKNAEDIAALNEKYGVGRDIYGQQRFEELMKGPTGISQVGNLNIAQQNQRARALQQLAGTANTEMGRRGLLQDTFRQGGKEYTQGMGSLDQLITSGDQQARDALVTGVQEQAQGLQGELGDIVQQSNIAKLAQEKAIRDFGGGIEELAQNPLTKLEEDLKTKVDQEKKLREKYLPLISDYEKGLSDRYNTLKNIYGAFSKASRAGQVDFADLMRTGNLGVPTDVYMDYYGLDGNYNNYTDLINAAKLSSDDLQRLGLDASKLGDQFTAESGIGIGGNRTDLSYGIGDIYNALNSYETSPVSKLLEEQGYNLDSFGNMGDLNVQNVASEEEFNRFNKLKGLLNQATSPETRKDIVTGSELESILREQGIMPEEKTGGTVNRGTTGGGGPIKKVV